MGSSNGNREKDEILKTELRSALDKMASNNASVPGGNIIKSLFNLGNFQIDKITEIMNI